MIQPPEGFEQSLKNYDPALSLRWGSAVGQWVIERTARIAVGKIRFLQFASRQPGVDPKAIEEYRSAQAGREVIHYVKELDRRVHDFLWHADLQRKGNGPVAKVAGLLRTFDAQRAAKRVESHEIAKQTADVISHALRKQSSKIHAGRVDEVIRDGFDLPQAPAPMFMPPKTLLDAYSRPLQAKPRKIHLATR